jgi:hypothetical protein
MNPTMVLLAAGMSTRYGRLKQLEPVGPKGEALLDYAAFDARRAGFSRVVLIIREELEEAFRGHIGPSWPDDLEVVFHHQRLEDLPGLPPGEERDPSLASALARRRKPWGTAHAILSARDLLQDPFVLLNADDFYGPAAFSQGLALLGRDLRRDPGDPPGFGLVAYTLEDTLTRHGGVTRGVCTVDRQGWLESVEEVFGVRRVGPAIAGTSVSGDEVLLTGQEPTSTNFWIFTPDIFPFLERGFQEFLEEAVAASGGVDSGEGAQDSGEEAQDSGEGGQKPAPEPEFLIPTQVNRLVARGEARVWILRTHDPFLGITHPQDWEWAAGGIRELVQEGLYPDPLWVLGAGGGGRR